MKYPLEIKDEERTVAVATYKDKELYGNQYFYMLRNLVAVVLLSGKDYIPVKEFIKAMQNPDPETYFTLITDRPENGVIVYRSQNNSITRAVIVTARIEGQKLIIDKGNKHPALNISVVNDLYLKILPHMYQLHSFVERVYPSVTFLEDNIGELVMDVAIAASHKCYAKSEETIYISEFAKELKNIESQYLHPDEEEIVRTVVIHNPKNTKIDKVEVQLLSEKALTTDKIVEAVRVLFYMCLPKDQQKKISKLYPNVAIHAQLFKLG